MFDDVDLRTQSLVFGFVHMIKRKYPKDVVHICVSFYFENDFFTQDSEWYLLQNQNKTAISLSTSKLIYESIHCNNFIDQWNQVKIHRWRFQIDAIYANATISFGILPSSIKNGYIGRWFPMDDIDKISFKKNDCIDIYLSFSTGQCQVFVHINDTDYDLTYKIDDFLVIGCGFTPAWQADVAGIKITLVNYKSMYLYTLN